jgi:hypothetical protein
MPQVVLRRHVYPGSGTHQLNISIRICSPSSHTPPDSPSLHFSRHRSVSHASAAAHYPSGQPFLDTMDAAGRRAAPLSAPSAGRTKRQRHTEARPDTSAMCGAALLEAVYDDDASPAAAFWCPGKPSSPPTPSTTPCAHACQEASAAPFDSQRIMTPAQRRRQRAAFRAQRGHVRFSRGRATTCAILDVPVGVDETDNVVDGNGGDDPYGGKDGIDSALRRFQNFPQQSHQGCASQQDNATDLVLSVLSHACPDVPTLDAPCRSPTDNMPRAPPATKLPRTQCQPRHRQGLIDKKQARIIRNREVALKARQAAKEKLAQLESDNDALSTNASCLETQNATLRRQIQALQHGFCGNWGHRNYP